MEDKEKRKNRCNGADVLGLMGFRVFLDNFCNTDLQSSVVKSPPKR